MMPNAPEPINAANLEVEANWKTIRTVRRTARPTITATIFKRIFTRRFYPELPNCCNQAWLLKNSIFSKTAGIWGIENV
jgi:hypothetical protein